ncbi:unnamed protein product, partial [Polarella glacialis]
MSASILDMSLNVLRELHDKPGNATVIANSSTGIVRVTKLDLSWNSPAASLSVPFAIVQGAVNGAAVAFPKSLNGIFSGSLALSLFTPAINASTGTNGTSALFPQNGTVGKTKNFWERRVLTIAPLDVSLLTLDDLGEVPVQQLPEPVLVRLSATDAEGDCVFFDGTSSWSPEGVKRASKEQLSSMEAMDSGSSTGVWCSTIHFSMFALAVLEDIPPGFDPGEVPAAGASRASAAIAIPVCLFLCCGAGLCLAKCRRPQAGSITLEDEKGRMQQVMFHVEGRTDKQAQKEGDTSDGEGVSQANSKIHVLWHLDVDKYKNKNYSASLFGKHKFLRGLSDVQGLRSSYRANEPISLQAESSEQDGFAQPEQPEVSQPMQPEATDLTELKSTMQPEATDPTFEQLQGAAGDQGLAPAEAYEPGSKVEYYSMTHKRWLTARINSSGNFRIDGMNPTYELKVGLQGQTRQFVDMHLLRPPLADGEPVEYFWDKQDCWLQAEVCGAQSSGTTLGYKLRLEYCPESLEAIIPWAPAAKIRRHFMVGSLVEVYRGPVMGWVAGEVAHVEEADPSQVVIDVIDELDEPSSIMPETMSRDDEE